MLSGATHAPAMAEAGQRGRVSFTEVCARLASSLAAAALVFVIVFALFGPTLFDWLMLPVLRACERAGVRFEDLLVTRTPLDMIGARAYLAALVAVGVMIPLVGHQVGVLAAPERADCGAGAAARVFLLSAAFLVLGVLCGHALALEPALRAWLRMTHMPGVRILWSAPGVVRFEALFLTVCGLVFQIPWLCAVLLRGAVTRRTSS